MATQTIKPKRSNVAGNNPTTSNLASGELGVNMADRKIFINNGTSVVQVGAGNISALGGVNLTSPVNGEYLEFTGTDWVNTDRVNAKTIYETVKNVSGTTIAKGTPVYQVGLSGNSPTVALARADDPNKLAIGVMDESVADQAEGRMLILGEIKGVNTLGFATGDKVYLGATGGYTNVAPTEPTVVRQFLGVVFRVDSTIGSGYITGTLTEDQVRYNAGAAEFWTGSLWKTLNFAATKVAVIGDSLSSMNDARTSHWVTYLQEYIRHFGDRCEIVDLAKGGSTYYTAYTNALYGTNTMVQECIDQKPDIVIVMLGLNDIASGRSQAQIISDSTNVYTTLRNALPNTKIIYGSEVWYDNSNFTPTTIKNKGVIPVKWNFNSSGILANSYTSEILETVVSSTIQTQATNWVALDTHIKALSQINGHYTFNHWKLARLGLFLTDGLHHNAEGSKLIANDVAYGLLANSSINALLPNFYTNAGAIIGTSSSIFGTVLTASGDGYTTVSGGDHDVITFESGLWRKYNPETWYMPYKGRLHVTNATVTLDVSAYLKLSLFNVSPNTEITKSINGGSYTSTNTTTDYVGNADLLLTGTDFGAVGTYTMRLKIGNEIYGPVTITVQSSLGTGTGGIAYKTTPTIIGLREVRVELPANSIDLSAGNIFTKTITTATTLSVTNVPNSGTTHTFILELTNGGAFPVTWWSGIKWPGGLVPPLTSSGRDVLGFYSHDGGITWTGFMMSKDAK